ncbi:MAG: hypothetical protein LC647_08110 [Beggiatoa sp.]|nr:hypothetical protein [Beggiatoa sp.]
MIDESLDPVACPAMEDRYRFTSAHGAVDTGGCNRTLFAKDPLRRPYGPFGPAGAARRRDCLLRRGRQRRSLAFAAVIKDMKALRHNA